MTHLMLFLLLIYLPSSVQQTCYTMPRITGEHPTVQIVYSPELVTSGKPLNITCIARRSEVKSLYFAPSDFNVFDVAIYFKGKVVKGCGGKFYNNFASMTCSLFISNASVSYNSGNYACNTRDVNNMCTRAIKAIHVKDPTAPRITENPWSQTNLTIGQELTMTCAAYGVPPPDITWTKDNISTTLPGNTTQYQGNSTSVVRIAAVNVTQFGVYRCQANNSEGVAHSSAVNITGAIAPLANMVREPSDDVIVSGTEVNITCIASPPRQYPISILSHREMNVRKIEIVKSGQHLETCGFSAVNSTITQEQSCVVTLRHTTVNDTGVYTCMASNTIGSVTVTLDATVKDPIVPMFVLHPWNKTVTSGDRNVTLECIATGIPQPVISWLKDGVPWGDQGSVYGNSSYSILVIPRVNATDTARYKCRARSSAGDTDSDTATLTVVSSKLDQLTFSTEKPKLGNPSKIQVSDNSPFIISGAVLAFIVFCFGFFFILRRYVNRWPWGQKRSQFYAFTSTVAFHNNTCTVEDGDVVAKLRHGTQSDSELNRTDETLDDDTYLRLLGADRNWEIARERLAISEEKLGGGEFGVVKKGFYTRSDGKKMTVAVKLLKDNAGEVERSALLTELEMLRRVGHHPHIVSLVGACTNQDPVSVVIEFVAGGSLEKILTKSRIDPLETISYVNIHSRLTERELLKIAAGVAQGMSHLEKKECIHRDLAARNVLIAEGLVAKVTDFGLARDISTHGKYIKTTEGKVAWKWLALESLQGVYSSKSDVWSFGILLWEIITLGKEPYKGERSVVSLYNKLQNGYHMEKPRHCSDELYLLMTNCWKSKPEDRPSFTEIHEELNGFLKDNERQYINVLCTDEDGNYCEA